MSRRASLPRVARPETWSRNERLLPGSQLTQKRFGFETARNEQPIARELLDHQVERFVASVRIDD